MDYTQAKNTKIVLLSARNILHFGFGSSVVLVKQGTLVRAEEQQRGFGMACGHVIITPQDIGVPCEACRGELEAAGLLAGLSDDEAELTCTTCHACTRRCDAAFCGRIGCLRHIGHGVDDKFFCAEHDRAARYAAEDATVQEAQGGRAVWRRKLWRTFFHD
jgi:hypothetical protein